MKDIITYADFEKIDIRVGRIVDVQDFPEARNPAYKLWVDFGSDIGIKKTSAQITQNYSHVDLKGKLVAAVVNFAPKQIGQFMSEVLVLGFTDDKGFVVLVSPDKDIPLGGKLH